VAAKKGNMTKTIERHVLQTLAAAGASLASPALVRAQTLSTPENHRRISAGRERRGQPASRGKLAPAYARNIIVDNRPGAAGRIAMMP
jgi:hypothetical protein